MSEMDKVRKRANLFFFSKVIFNALLMIAGAVLISVFLRSIQHQSSLYKQQVNSKEILNETIQILDENTNDAQEITRVFHHTNQQLLNDLRKLLSTGMFDSLADADESTRAEVFADIVSRSDVDYLFIMDQRGTILASPVAGYAGRNICAAGLLDKKNLDPLVHGTEHVDGTSDPVHETNSSGSFYLYSMPISFRESKYLIVLGMDEEVLQTHLASLDDLSAVLSHSSAGTGGFLFAVDSASQSFLYFPEEICDVNGKNALDAGLSEEVFNDGYAGRQMINGTEYYCVSRVFQDSVVVCAASETAEIYADDKYVLFWSVTGFVLVMILCLVYAVIIRNDFVRKAEETQKKVIGHRRGDPVYFDISIFRKVFPLMLAGVMLIFGISFYTQTLLEISQCIRDSDTALEEVSTRYRKSTENRAVIGKYYNERFLSKARMISCLIEEDPSALNAETDRYYSEFDNDGSRTFLSDDEGNRLKSVSLSSGLQEICDDNEISSLYVFDQDGHVIATNTENWFFILSHNPEDQSYIFHDVLSGRKDYIIQEAMTDDMGEENQYIGAALYYYTGKDEDGNTLYLSRRDYEAYMEGTYEGEAVGEITRRRGMAEIGLDAELSGRILSSTDVKSVLSSEMLGSGFIVLFDDSPEHLCLYSPNEASLNQPASDLGISEKAFTGLDYYGFLRVNGVRYFQMFRYKEGYFLATAIPRAQMYQTRTAISLITSLTSLLLILILSGTVTVTTKEEEELYEYAGNQDAEEGLNSAIFSVLLPSGRRAATVQAASRWDNRHIPWSEKSPEQKLMVLISILGGLIIVFVCTAVFWADVFFADNSVIRYIISGGWDRELNVFAVSGCIIVIVMVTVLSALFRIPVRMISELLGARGETIAHLLLSVVKYGGAIGALFYCLYLLGVDAQNLLASAGILSLVIGLGAQSLIKDILAGIFIVFEGEFRVGDIVTIDGFRGTVMDIGLRTTKIMGIDGNVKIFNNSDISGVLNMTKEVSLAYCRIGIEYGQDIGYVEEVLKRELPLLKENNHQILDGPFYAGVEELGESAVVLVIYSKCSELNILGVTRYMNREILNIFYRNEINVPFPHITVVNGNPAEADSKNSDPGPDEGTEGSKEDAPEDITE